MQSISSAAVAAILACAAASGQDSAAKLEFEVASIRPTQSTGIQRVDAGLHMDGSQARIIALNLREYVALAYRVRQNRVTGADANGGQRFDLTAKLPEGAKPAQIPDMLQSFLADRFHLKVHRETKEAPVYALVLGKTPLQLKPSPGEPEAGDSGGAVNVAVSGSADGISANLGNGSSYSLADDKLEARKITLDTFANVLERFLDRPVVNQTELKGRYDFTLNVTPEDYRALLLRSAANAGVFLPPRALQFLDEGSPVSLFDALQQLGLKLDTRKAPLEYVVVDQALKAPTEN